MKTKEELCALRSEVEALSGKLRELSEEELSQVTGGVDEFYDLYDIFNLLNEAENELRKQAELLRQ